MKITKIVDTKMFQLFLVIFLFVFCSSINTKGELNSITPHPPKSIKVDTIDYFGKWRVIKYILTDGVCAITQKQVDSLVGKEIIIGSKYTVVFKDSCKMPVFKTHKENTRKLMQEEYRQENSIGIKQDTITVVNIFCGIAPIYGDINSGNFNYSILLLNNKNLIMDYQGVFFVFKRTNKQ